MNMRFVAAILFAMSWFVVLPADAKVKAVASFTILADMASQVGGDRVEVTTIVGPYADAHVHEPKPGDAKAMAAADVVFVNGLAFEGFLDRLVLASGFTKDIVTASAGISELAAADGTIDPHAWHDIGNAKIYVKNIAQGLCKVDAGSCGLYQGNALAYSRKLDALDAEIKDQLAGIAVERRIVVTSHDAFAYLGRAYAITFLAPEGVNTESEASARDVARIIRQVRSEKATALFVENISDPRLVEQIASETGLQVGGELYSDALSDTSGPAPNFIQLMQHNATLLSQAMKAGQP
jgi:zinc/manganese transport system substrate-binding protein